MINFGKWLLVAVPIGALCLSTPVNAASGPGNLQFAQLVGASGTGNGNGNGNIGNGNGNGNLGNDNGNGGVGSFSGNAVGSAPNTLGRATTPGTEGLQRQSDLDHLAGAALGAATGASASDSGM